MPCYTTSSSSNSSAISNQVYYLPCKTPELVMEEILSKKQMKMYFSFLPCSSSTALPTAAMDLKDYTPITLVKLFNDDKDDKSPGYFPVNVQDIDSALRKILTRHCAQRLLHCGNVCALLQQKLDGREKRRNFEAAKKSVDHCSKWLHYYISRICGIASEIGADRKQVSGDSMLSLVTSIPLNK